MTMLRSREIPPSASGKPRHSSDIIQPSTPARTQEPSAHPEPTTLRRRSLRVASRGDAVESPNGSTEKEVSGKRKSNVGERFLSLRSGKKVAKRSVEKNGIEISKLDLESESNEGIEVDGSGSKRKRVCVEEDDAVGDILVDEETQVLVDGTKNKGKAIAEDVESCEKPSSSSVSRRKFTREEKGKSIQVENVITNEVIGEMEIQNSQNVIANEIMAEVEIQNSVKPSVTAAENLNGGGETGNASRNQHFRNFAERNASRFAHFDAGIDEEDEDLSDKEVEKQVEDWPGPFSTAMKIIKDREEENTYVFSSSNEERPSPIIWAPRRNEKSFTTSPRAPPSLQELSMRVLVKNADAITCLDYVPDSLRVKLCQLLCDSRRMNTHFLDLLVRGSPTGICVPDCSWLTEEEFTQCFNNCDTTNLMVLQLDQCGRCMPDYVLPSTLARSPKNLPMLSSLSLSGACRLSDVGLRALVSVAPAIRSINLSQCSLLTSSSIDMLSDSLGSVLRELYLNECQGIDLKLILTALKKFEKLEVLSLVDLPSVRGRFLREFVIARGHALKQLILTNSVKLTDSFIKDISENCPSLSVLDLANVCKLTDCALGYLANGCQAVEKLIFCRNSFSDEAVAAFVETSGGSLVELSLNNVKKVGHNTALALAKFSAKLQILDVSWCRDMSDDALGYIVDNCSSLKVLKVFGCTQITDAFVRGHSNPNVKILGLKMDPFLDHLSKNLAD